jgi:signal transduction histidine kinase
MTRKILDLHEGLITVRSEPGKGAVFTVFLPRERMGE